MLKKKKSNQEEITMENILKTMEEIKSYISSPTYIVGDTIDLSCIKKEDLESDISSVTLPTITTTTTTSPTWIDNNTGYWVDNNIGQLAGTAINIKADPYTFENEQFSWSILEEKIKLVEEIESLKKYINELESVLVAREKFFNV